MMENVKNAWIPWCDDGRMTSNCMSSWFNILVFIFVTINFIQHIFAKSNVFIEHRFPNETLNLIRVICFSGSCQRAAKMLTVCQNNASFWEPIGKFLHHLQSVFVSMTTMAMIVGFLMLHGMVITARRKMKEIEYF